MTVSDGGLYHPTQVEHGMFVRCILGLGLTVLPFDMTALGVLVIGSGEHTSKIVGSTKDLQKMLVTQKCISQEHSGTTIRTNVSG